MGDCVGAELRVIKPGSVTSSPYILGELGKILGVICKAFLYIPRRVGEIALRALALIVGPLCPSPFISSVPGIVLSAVNIDIHDKLCLHLE